MTLPQSDAGSGKLARAGLAACILGLVLCPFAYIAMGALRGFAPAFSWLTLPPLLAGSGYLLYRFLSNRPRATTGKVPLLLELISALLIAAFLVIVSGFTLFSIVERVGLFCMLFLICTLLALPIVLLRKTALADRLARLQGKLSLGLMLLVLLAAIAATGLYLIRPPAFL